MTNIKMEFWFIMILVGFVFANFFHDHLVPYLIHSIKQEALSIGLLIEIQGLLETSTHVPLIGADASKLSESLSQVVKYLTWSDAILTLQLILFKISKTLLFKAMLLLAIGALFISSFRLLSLKILMILLFINPGLPAYVTLTNYISQEVKLDDGANLHSKIQEIHQKYSEKEKEHQQAESQRDQKQLERATAKGRKDIGGLKKLEDKVLDDGEKVINRSEEEVSEGIAVIKVGRKELLILAINYLVTVGVQYLLLPFLFLYAVVQLINRFLNHEVTDAFLKKVLVLLFITVLTSGSTHLIAKSVKESGQTADVIKPVDVSQERSQVLGIDVSHFQTDVNWEEIKSAGISFVYTKATQSVNFIDPKFSHHWASIKTAGLIRGCYHFYMAGEDPKAQAELFIRAVGEIDENDLPPMLDLEQGGMKKGIDPSKYSSDVFIWLDAVEKAFGKRPIIYTDHPFGSKYLKDPKFGQYALWIADWEKRSEPLVPEVWKGQWIIWQRTEIGKIEGAIGNVDHDLFNGSQKELKKLK